MGSVAKCQGNLWLANFERFCRGKFCRLASLNKKFSMAKVPKFAVRNFSGILQQALMVFYNAISH